MGFGNRGSDRGGRGSSNIGGKSRGGGSFRGGSRGGSRGGYNRRQDNDGPPEMVEEIGQFSHLYEDGIICIITHDKIPYFNAPIYLENKEQVGRVDEVFGQLAHPHFHLKLLETFNNDSFKKGSKFYIPPYKLLTKDRLIPQSTTVGSNKTGENRGGRGGRRGRGTFGNRGSSASRGASGGRGGFDSRKRNFGSDSRGGSTSKVIKFS